jgi:exodeoxyribonuclease V
MNHYPRLQSDMLHNLGYPPTEDQHLLAGYLSAFLSGTDTNGLFLIKGYAGTGKTSMVSSLVKTFMQYGYDIVLLAPTGRAAKVLSAYSGQKANTIHKKIYRLHTSKDGSLNISLQPNKHKNTLFLTDEASMIPGNADSAHGSLFGGMNLLDDLIQYVYSGRQCRLILIGDTAQLPPVHTLESPALSPAYLRNRYELKVEDFELTEVVRQTRESGILFNASLLRNMLVREGEGFPRFHRAGFPDFIRLDGDDMLDEISHAFQGREADEALVVCRSNKRARLFNENIRQRILFREEELSSGDLLMAVKNNYHWLPPESPAGFIANGDTLEIKRIWRFEDIYGFRFADVSIALSDYPEQPVYEIKLLLNTLHSDTASLSTTEQKQLYEAVSGDYAHLSKRNRLKKVKENPYFNAIQVKFAYALTCHKAQGGQWKKVFVDMGYMPDKAPDKEYLRWLYTALTRATDKLYLMHFRDEFFVD